MCRGIVNMENKSNFLLDIDLLDKTESEAFASQFNIGGQVTWIKFVLTDDQPNVNKQRVPKEEFANLIKTGHLMPIKMALGGIKESHADAVPLGVIANLKEDGNRILGIGALWNREREQDIETIRNKIKEGKLPQLSWEILFAVSSKDDETGVEELRETSLRATTIVGLPAYEGRTPVLAFASKTDDELKSYLEDEANIELVERIKKILKEEESSVDEIEKLKAEIETLKAQLSEKDTAIASLSSEIEPLKEYKEAQEKLKAEAEKFASIKKTFADAGLEKDEEFFNEKKESLMALDENALNFMVQELVAFKEASASANNSNENSIPNFPSLNSEADLNDPKKLAMALKASEKSK